MERIYETNKTQENRTDSPTNKWDYEVVTKEVADTNVGLKGFFIMEDRTLMRKWMNPYTEWLLMGGLSVIVGILLWGYLYLEETVWVYFWAFGCCIELFLVYAFSGFCAGVTGLIESSLIRAADANNAGLNMEMDAILAVALGGTLLSGGKFYLGGSVIGAITIQTLTTTLYALGVSADQLPVVKAIAVIAICLIQSKKARDLFDKWKSGRSAKAVTADAKAVNKA